MRQPHSDSGPSEFRRLELPLPSSRVALAQLAISVLDWTIAATVLYVLLPPGRAPFLALLGAFLASQLLGLASHVPGGMGVFEGLMVLLLKPFLPSTGFCRRSSRTARCTTCCRCRSLRSYSWPTKSTSAGRKRRGWAPRSDG